MKKRKENLNQLETLFLMFSDSQILDIRIYNRGEEKDTHLLIKSKSLKRNNQRNQSSWIFHLRLT